MTPRQIQAALPRERKRNGEQRTRTANARVQVSTENQHSGNKYWALQQASAPEKRYARFWALCTGLSIYRLVSLTSCKKNIISIILNIYLFILAMGKHAYLSLCEYVHM